jgi:Tfp pilus tip-associated adhesin PilY1
MSPTAVDDYYTMSPNTSLTVPSGAGGILSNDSVDSLYAIQMTDPSFGALIFDNEGNQLGSFVYTPAVNFTGMDSFAYVSNDGVVDSNVATVFINVVETVSVALDTLSLVSSLPDLSASALLMLRTEENTLHVGSEDRIISVEEEEE